jgi:hypothetical protein
VLDPEPHAAIPTTIKIESNNAPFCAVIKNLHPKARSAKKRALLQV